MSGRRRRHLRLTLLQILVAGAALTGCSGHRATAYHAPPRQQPVLADSLSPRQCSSSTMGGGLLAVCDPALLEKAWQNHTLTQPGLLQIEIPGRKISVGSSPALTQVLPADGIGSLGVPAKVTLKGTASDGSYLYIRASSLEPDHYATGEALFRHLGLAHGGTATIDVRLEDGRVAFVLRRPDGSEPKPFRSSHLDGPGPRAALPELPAGYANTPEQGVRTFVAALNAHDGKTICELWTADLRARAVNGDYPCWAVVTGLIGHGEDSDSPIFQRAELVRIGKPYERTSYGVSFTAVPVTIRSHYLTSRYSGTSEARDTSTAIWLRQTSDGWRIAKDPLSAGSEDASAPPDPYAALHAKQAEERKAAEQRAARRRTAVRLEPELSCPGGGLTVEDGVRDPDGVTPNSTAQLDASSDVVAASVVPSGRRVCFSIRFRGRPLTGSRRIALTLLYTPSSSSSSGTRYASFRIDHDFPTADGLHAGLLDPTLGPDVTTPAQARVAVARKTIHASFRLPPSFPSVRGRGLARLGLTILATGRLRERAPYVSDRAEAGLTQEKLDAAAAKAEREREAKKKAAEQARQAKAWAPARVRFNSGRVRCRGKHVHAVDTASDARLTLAGRATRLPASPLAAGSDLRTADVAVSGRHVCFAVSLGKQLFGRRQRRLELQLWLTFTYKTKTVPYLRRSSFGIETNARLENGLTYAGIGTGSDRGPRPSNAHVELHGTTVSADFDLDRSFPPLRPRDLTRLTWKVDFFGSNVPSLGPDEGALDSYDQLPDNPDKSGKSVEPEIRQSNGRTVTPY